MSATTPEVVHLDRETVKRGLADGSILLVDVREPDEFEAGHIPGAVLFPLSTFVADDLPDPQGRRLVFSCRSGKRSQTAIAHAAAAGLPWREHYAGGILDWVGAGEPVAQD
ncbi:rhodanese-like domain-containing protein [Camelimonas lactis]|uniref:Rhodanese-related sulfurtransferase n=1 Tax=Camelimonas lactis TaxID=659006 RepID=A0A4R2GXH1_9HYPH|nr:rhodanese-like domain-containing protein [Camelimonas lactis]TCO14263.1 rhodanese-related sulfurtransferase [Camelimonas lactis]